MANTYNPKKVQVIFGNKRLTGFEEGTFITVEMKADAFTPIVGSDGEGARVASADESGSITITLMQTSASNDHLSAQLTADRLSNLVTSPFMLKDGSGRTLVQASEAWVRKMANVDLSNEKSPRVWVIDSTNIKVLVAGNG